MSIYKTILKRRSIRRFKQRPIGYSVLKKIVDAARFAPTAANLQPCEFIIVDKKSVVDQIFPYTRWAGYLGNKGAPVLKKTPVAYVSVLINSSKCKKPKYAQADLGAAVENMLLVATELGVGSCWLGAIDREKIARVLSVPKNVSVEYLVALGYPDEKSKTLTMKKSHKYYKDKQGRMHIPKRRLSWILHHNKY